MDKEKKTAFEVVEDSLKAFWREKGDSPIIKAKHTEITVEPKVFMHGQINPEVMKVIVREYLANMSPEDIAKGRVIITSDLIKIRNEQGKLIAEVRSKKLIDSMMNRITNFLGKALSERKSTEGAPYVEPHEDNAYRFGEIKGAVEKFLSDMQKSDSKNIVRDAIVLIRNN